VIAKRRVLSLGQQLSTKTQGSHAADMAWSGACAAPQLSGQGASTLEMGSKQARVYLSLVRRPCCTCISAIMYPRGKPVKQAGPLLALLRP
jgi:hypothetical protein